MDKTNNHTDTPQALADSFAAAVMEKKYGDRWTSCSNVEDDAWMNADYEYLNEKFYETISKIL